MEVYRGLFLRQTTQILLILKESVQANLMRLPVVLRVNFTNNDELIQSLPLLIVLIFASEDVSAKPFLGCITPLSRYLLLANISGVTQFLRWSSVRSIFKSES